VEAMRRERGREREMRKREKKKELFLWRPFAFTKSTQLINLHTRFFFLNLPHEGKRDNIFFSLPP
jgi:hypothetical protein